MGQATLQSAPPNHIHCIQFTEILSSASNVAFLVWSISLDTVSSLLSPSFAFDDIGGSTLTLTVPPGNVRVGSWKIYAEFAITIGTIGTSPASSAR
jgi:hypothetical protein